ncbi:hypothetical protein SHLO109777_13815 [Shewanella loihica]|uniref:hypothetical protein n=1 Tax=Shewanella loihica TaxID=359303 RepID=UPI00059BB30D|nr:hypothetical protein [Shewanella loihica]
MNKYSLRYRIARAQLSCHLLETAAGQEFPDIRDWSIYAVTRFVVDGNFVSPDQVPLIGSDGRQVVFLGYAERREIPDIKAINVSSLDQIMALQFYNQIAANAEVGV